MVFAKHQPRQGHGVMRSLATVCSVVGCFALLVNQMEPINFSSLVASLREVDPWQWTVALASIALSFMAIGQYDVLFHRWMQTGISDTRAARSGASAIALSQTLGFGLVTASVARWRGLPELHATQCFFLTQCVSLSFMAALGVLLAGLSFMAPWNQSTALLAFAVTGITLTTFALAASLLRPAFLPFHLPALGLMARLFGFLVIDVFFAATALYVLLPAEATIPFGTLFVAFVVALSAGLLSGAPAGLGPFELCLFMLLPTVPEADLLTAILAFRIVGYALPAVIGFLWLTTPRAALAEATPDVHAVSTRAEASGLSELHGHGLYAASRAHLHIAEASQALVAIGDPTNREDFHASDLNAFKRTAKTRGLIPALYKSGSRMAAVARRAGWSVMRVSEEAILEPHLFDLSGSKRRQLRRKLKHAENAGVAIEIPDLVPYHEMHDVAKAWAQRCGGERGFSMGRFDPGYVSKQVTILARKDGRLLAFATFHVADTEWCLDLMRSENVIPDGTMHAIVVAALNQAAELGIRRLSLAAMPLDGDSSWITKVAGANGQGLRRFKLSFAPETRPLYLAAPSLFHLALVGSDILLRIRRPDSCGTQRLPRALQKMQSGLSKLSIVGIGREPHIKDSLET